LAEDFGDYDQERDARDGRLGGQMQAETLAHPASRGLSQLLTYCVVR